MNDVKVFIMARMGPGGRTVLRGAMDEEGVGVHRLKAATGVNHQTLANLANGRGGVEKQKAERIAEALGRPLGALFVHKDGADLVEF